MNNKNFQNPPFRGQGDIDAHQHFWKFHPTMNTWITDEMSILRNDFLPANLEPLLKENGFDGCVLVQSEQTEEHNEFLLEQAHSNPFIKGIVGGVDLQNENIIERLSYYKQFDIIKGWRHVLQDEEDRAFMLRPEFMRGIHALREFDYTYDILVHNDQLQFVPDLVAAFPDQKFVLDHVGKPDIKNKNIDEWAHHIINIAQHENVFCKVSGMLTEAAWNDWTKADIIPYIDVAVEAFGPDNIMFGSDWPVCLLTASYNETVGLLKEYFLSFTLDEQDKFFRQNAINFYNL